MVHYSIPMFSHPLSLAFKSTLCGAKIVICGLQVNQNWEWEQGCHWKESEQDQKASPSPIVRSYRMVSLDTYNESSSFVGAAVKPRRMIFSLGFEQRGGLVVFFPSKGIPKLLCGKHTELTYAFSGAYGRYCFTVTNNCISPQVHS